MQTPLVPVRRPNPKTALYVGGLEESVNEAVLHAAFIPFGDIKARPGGRAWVCGGGAAEPAPDAQRRARRPCRGC